jgi:hypothetical protein
MLYDDIQFEEKRIRHQNWFPPRTPRPSVHGIMCMLLDINLDSQDNMCITFTSLVNAFTCLSKFHSPRSHRSSLTLPHFGVSLRSRVRGHRYVSGNQPLRFPNSLLPIAPATVRTNQFTNHHVPRRRHRFSHHPQCPFLLPGKSLPKAIIGFAKDVGALDAVPLHPNHVANPRHL